MYRIVYTKLSLVYCVQRCMGTRLAQGGGQIFSLLKLVVECIHGQLSVYTRSDSHPQYPIHLVICLYIVAVTKTTLSTSSDALLVMWVFIRKYNRKWYFEYQHLPRLVPISYIHLVVRLCIVTYDVIVYITKTTCQSCGC